MTRPKREQQYRMSDNTMQIDRSTIAEQMERATSASKHASFIILGGLDVGSVVEIEGMEAILGCGRPCRGELEWTWPSRGLVDSWEPLPPA